MIHREGIPTIIITFLLTLLLTGIGGFLFTKEDGSLGWGMYFVWALNGFLIVTVLQFFRNPKRNTQVNPNHVMCPADGKVVVIEEVEEPEYFKDKRIQVSVFMSPINVHVNRFPVAGTVKYAKYHPGLYLVAWHPKSSTENERTSIVVETEKGQQVLFRQIAGALARRIVYYCKEGDKAEQGGEFGFIKFGSRVDLFFPLGTKINVELNQVVRGGETVLASW